jgi:curved DNA-binding protein
LEVKIPPGANTGTKVRIPNAISTGIEGEKSDLFLVIQVEADLRFERKGDDLHTDGNMDIYTAVLGGELKVPTLTGTVVLTIPPGTQPGQSFRLAGKGMPKLKNPKVFGNLLVRAKMEIPRKLSPKQRQLFQELADLNK